MNAETEATIAPIVDGEGQLSVAIQPEVHGAQPASNSWKADAQPPKHNQEPSTEASIDNEEDVPQRTKDRLKYKRGIRTVQLFRFRLPSAKEANSSYLVRNRAKYPHRGEHDINMILPEAVHDRMYCKSLCGLTLGESLVNEARYAVDVIAMFVFFIGNPLICWAAAISAMFSEENVPDWFPFVGAYFFIAVVPTVFYLIMSDCYSDEAEFLERDTKEVLRCLIPAALCCWFVSPFYGIYSIASFSLDAGADANPALFYAAYICCFLCLPCWPFGPMYVYSEYEYDIFEIFDTRERTLFGVLLFVVCGVLIGSAIHQAVVGELIWFPFLGAIGLIAITPVVVFVFFAFELEPVLSYCTDGDYSDHTVFAAIVSYVIFTLLFTALVATKDLSEPIPKLLEDDLLYGGAVMFYIEGIGTALHLLYFISVDPLQW